MKFKAGQLVMVRSSKIPTDIGIITTIKSFKPTNEGDPAYLLDLPEVAVQGILRNWKREHCLIPIDNPKGDDETLTWAGKPKEIQIKVEYEEGEGLEASDKSNLPG